jgi:hypothetical protein
MPFVARLGAHLFSWGGEGGGGVWGEHGIQSVAVRSSTSVLSAFTHPLVVRGFEKSPEESSLDSGQEDVPVV